ncbi:MAG: sialate O-acetylesterase [Bacteroidota bacterium]
MKRILLLFILCWSFCQAKIWTPSVISDHMVLQRNSTAKLWGWSTNTNEELKIFTSWDEKETATKVDQGYWEVELATPEAGGPYEISIIGHENLSFKNIMIGEVWICSGQSNMEWTPLMGLDNAEEEIAAANFPNIRFFTAPKRKSDHPQDDIPAEWAECSPETMKNFSSVAYFFGRKLHKNLEVPIGLINTNWGGTNVEVWIPQDRFVKDEALVRAAEKIRRVPWWPEEVGVCYNAMIHPFIKFNIAGAIWYQGESNRVNAFSYYKSFPLMIESWRDLWDKEFPFYFAQIAPFNYKSKLNIDAAVVRDAQLYTMLNVPNTGMAVTNDIGNLADIHPQNKQDVGKRLALWALAKTYGRTDVTFSGPIYSSMEIRKNSIVLSFDHVGGGLMKKGDELKEFYIAGKDKVFHKAEARIKGDKIWVSSSKVNSPHAVRFAFSNKAEPNLFNRAGLPASAFRTDDWEIILN